MIRRIHGEQKGFLRGGSVLRQNPLEPCPILSRFVEDEIYRNDLDICSKIAFFRMEAETDVRQEVRRELRLVLPSLVGSDRFTRSEKLKFILIAWAWQVYCRLLLRAKAAG